MKTQNHGCRVSSMGKRRGSMYVAVMGVALIVSIVGFSALGLARVKLREARANNELFEARLLAMSGVEICVCAVNKNIAWRTTMLNGFEYPVIPITLGNGSITYKLVDEIDADLSDNATEPVRAYGIGRVGDAVHVQSVLLEFVSGTEMRITPGSWRRETAP